MGRRGRGGGGGGYGLSDRANEKRLFLVASLGEGRAFDLRTIELISIEKYLICVWLFLEFILASFVSQLNLVLTSNFGSINFNYHLLSPLKTW